MRRGSVEGQSGHDPAYTIAFYGRHGLVPVGTLPDVHGPRDEGTVYMRKVLR